MCGTGHGNDIGTPIKHPCRRPGWIGYVTYHLITRKQGVETVALAFTDHLAVILRLAIDSQLPVRGKGYWKMNTFYLHEMASRNVFKEHWQK
jgi:hypothetical protein